MQKLAVASKYLTIWSRFTAHQPAPAKVGAAMIYFPCIGLVFGLLLALANYGLSPYLPAEIVSVTLITLLIGLTGGIHLEALRLTFDQTDPNPVPLPIRYHGTPGLIAIIVLIFFKVAAVDSIDQRLTVSLLLTPVLARWTLLVFVFGYQERCHEIARVMAQELKFWHLFIATAGTLALTFYSLGRKGLWIALLLSLFGLLTRNLLHRCRTTRITEANFGAMIELAEALGLTLMASI